MLPGGHKTAALLLEPSRQFLFRREEGREFQPRAGATVAEPHAPALTTTLLLPAPLPRD